MARLEFIPLTPLSDEYLAEVKRERDRAMDDLYRMCMVPRDILDAVKSSGSTSWLLSSRRDLLSSPLRTKR